MTFTLADPSTNYVRGGNALGTASMLSIGSLTVYIPSYGLLEGSKWVIRGETFIIDTSSPLGGQSEFIYSAPVSIL
jgi:hypothetical protein